MQVYARAIFYYSFKILYQISLYYYFYKNNTLICDILTLYQYIYNIFVIFYCFSIVLDGVTYIVLLFT